MKHVGSGQPRLDGNAKVTGKACYVDDLEIPGMWHGVVVRSTIPHGHLISKTFDPAFDWKSVVVADGNAIPGRNCVAMIEEDLPLIVTDIIKHVGEAILLIAAPTRELALRAREHVHITSEPLEPLLTLDASKAARIRIHGEENILARCAIHKGDVEKGFRDADVIVEGRYEMGPQEHMYIEPQGMIAIPEKGGKLSIIGSLQCPYYVSKAISILMGLPEEAISVKQATVGGAFGGKEDYPSVIAGYASVLAHACQKPVKIIYERDEDTEVTTKRHPAVVHHHTGVTKEGKLTAMRVSFELDGGAYVTLTPVVLSRGILHSTGPYRCPHVQAEAYAYATNTSPNGAFRGFGAPQAFFPLEVHMDRIAETLGISPLKLREMNHLREGDTTATGQVLKESVGCGAVLTEAVRRSDFEAKWQQLATRGHAGRIRRGIGLSLFLHGAGFTGSGEALLKGKAALRLNAEGRIVLLTACTEMGQGAHTVLPQIVAEALGVTLDHLLVETPDTALVPNSGPTVASRTTMVMGTVFERCASELKEKLIDYAAREYACDPKRVTLRDDALLIAGKAVTTLDAFFRAAFAACGALTVEKQYSLPSDIHWDESRYQGDAYPTYSWGCDVAEVEVDLDTFEVRVLKMWLVQDIGRAINPVLAKGQIEGGTVQALGWGIMEQHCLNEGRYLTNRFQNYIIPTIADVPEMETVIVECPYSHGPLGAKGVGELPMDGGAPAIANAIAQATGVRCEELPVTPERIYARWAAAQGEGKRHG